MEPNTLIYALNEFIVIYRKFYKIILIIDKNFIIINIFSIIKFQGRLLGNHIDVKIFCATWIYMVARYIC